MTDEPMADRPKQTPHLAPGGARRAAARDERLARALRDNLARRKAQQRAREGTGSATGSAVAAALTAGGEPGDS